MSIESTSPSGTVLITYSDRTATVAMNRPEAMNALNPKMLYDFINALKEVSENDEVDVVIIKGMGKHFPQVVTLR